MEISEDGDEDDDAEEQSAAGRKKKTPQKKRIYRWRKKEPPISNISSFDNFTNPPKESTEWTPLRYFKQFWDDSITDMLVSKRICTVFKRRMRVSKQRKRR